MSDESQEQPSPTPPAAPLAEKLANLRRAAAAATDPTERFQLEQQIQQIEAAQTALAQVPAAAPAPDVTSAPDTQSAPAVQPRGFLAFIRTHYQRIMTIGVFLGFLSICSALLFAPVGVLLLASLFFGSSGIMFLLTEIERLRGKPGWHLSAYGFAALLIALGFCGPLYLFFLLARILNAS